MTETPSDRITVELSATEARLVVAALRQFEPYWPSDMDDMSRTALLSSIHDGIDRVVTALDQSRPSRS